MTNGPAAPTTNGSAGAQTATPTPAAPSTAVATGPQTSAPSDRPRTADGKFAPVTSKPTSEASSPQDDDPEIDLGDVKLKRSALKSELGRARNANKILSEAEKRAKAAEALEKAAAERKQKYREDHDAFFEDIGLTDPAEQEKWLAARIYKRHIEPEQLNEDQKARRAAEEKLARYEAEEKRKAEEAEKAKQAEEDAQTKAEIEAELRAAVKAGQLPGDDPYFVALVAQERMRLEQKLPNAEIDLATVVERVKERTQKQFAHVATNVSVDDLRNILGHDAFKAHVRKVLEWAKTKARPAQTAPPKPQSIPAPRPQSTQYISPAELALGKVK